MKHIMKLENFVENTNIKSDPHIGDYVICDPGALIQDLHYFISNHVGQYARNSINSFGDFPYIIYYEDAPIGMIKNEEDAGNEDKHIGFCREEILFFSSDKEDCEAYIAAKKYNL